MKQEYTIQELLQKGLNILENEEMLSPLLDTQLLLEYTLNVDRTYIYTHRDEVVIKENVDKFLSLVHKREKGYPIQYILGKQEFMGLDFIVGEGVLVPRADTEVLIEYILEIVNSGRFKHKQTINILDIGTGSGAITLSLAHYIKNAFVYSIDISEDALKIAKENTKRLNLASKVEFLRGSLFEPLETLKNQNKFDIIVSNPPYIPSDEIKSLQKEVAKYEPRVALDGGIDGLDFYRSIIFHSTKYLLDGALLAFEIGYNQGDDVKKLLESVGNFQNIEIRKDLAGHDRVVLASFSKYSVD